MAIPRSVRIEKQCHLEVLTLVDDEFSDNVTQEWLTHVVRHAVNYQDPTSVSSISLIITGDETVRELNKKYRGIDESTDILSFSFQHSGEYQGEEDPDTEYHPDEQFQLPPDAVSDLGELIISYPQARKQAEDAGQPVEKEIAQLITHGVLHLLGYNHTDPSLDTRMRTEEREMLNAIFPG